MTKPTFAAIFTLNPNIVPAVLLSFYTSSGIHFWLHSNFIDSPKSSLSYVHSSHDCSAVKTTASCIFSTLQMHRNACKLTKIHCDAVKCTWNLNVDGSDLEGNTSLGKCTANACTKACTKAFYIYVIVHAKTCSFWCESASKRLMQIWMGEFARRITTSIFYRIKLQLQVQCNNPS